MDELDGGRRANEPLPIGVVGREEHEQRPQALAARGDRRARVLGERRAVTARELPEALLDTREQARDVVAGGADDLRDGTGDGHRQWFLTWVRA